MRDIRSKRCRATRESAKRASRPAQTRRVPTTDKRLCQECSFTRERKRERETATVLIIISENELFACRIPEQQQKQKSIRPRIHFFHPHLFSSFPFLPFPSLPFSLLSFPSIHSFLFEIRPFPPRRGIVENVSLRLVSISRLRCSDVTRGVAR